VSAAASPVWNCVGTLRVFISGVQKTTCLASSEPSCSDSAVRKLQTFNAERRTKILRFFFSTEGAPFGLTLLLGNKTGRTADVDLKTNLHVKMRRDTAGKEPAEGERGCHKLTLFFFFFSSATDGCHCSADSRAVPHPPRGIVYAITYKPSSV